MSIMLKKREMIEEFLNQPFFGVNFERSSSELIIRLQLPYFLNFNLNHTSCMDCRKEIKSYDSIFGKI